MVVVHARFRLKPGAHAAFARHRDPMVAATRAEAGCTSYAVYTGTEDRDEVLFVEEWTSRAALEAHFATAHFAAFVAAVGAVTTGAPEVRIYAATGVETA
jgi:quinol monooxygenase YgiN